MDVWGKRTFYELLEVTRQATQDEVSRAYRLQQAAWHPDKFGGPEIQAIAKRRTQAVNAAYETLRDTRRRRAYDESLPPEDVELDVFPEPIQNSGHVWKRMARWM